MTVVIYGSCPDCDRSTGLAGALCFSTAAAPGLDRVRGCVCGSRRRPVSGVERESVEGAGAAVDGAGSDQATRPDLLAVASPRPWEFVGDGQYPVAAQWGYLWHPPSRRPILEACSGSGSDAATIVANLKLAVVAVNEYEALLECEAALRHARDWFADEGLARESEDAALARLDTIRGAE